MKHLITYTTFFLFLLLPLFGSATGSEFTQTDLEFVNFNMPSSADKNEEVTLTGYFKNNGNTTISTVKLKFYVGKNGNGNGYGLANGNNGNGNAYGTPSFTKDVDAVIAPGEEVYFETSFIIDDNFKTQDNIVVIYPGLNDDNPDNNDYEGGIYVNDSENVLREAGTSLTDNNDYQIFPNPAKEQLSIISPNGVAFTWSLMDISGRATLQSQEPVIEARVPVAILDEGFYILRIIDAEGNSIVRKIMVSR